VLYQAVDLRSRRYACRFNQQVLKPPVFFNTANKKSKLISLLRQKQL
jgi:hypothetical protein